MKPLVEFKNLLLSDPPAIHGQGTLGGASVTIEAIASFVAPGDRTMETGAGISTLLLVFLGTTHTSVTPAPEEAGRVRQWLETHNIPTASLSFEYGLSWDILPTLKAQQLDFAFIDGCHGFPVPFIDFFYFARNLRDGGILGIDDVHLWTGMVLVNFLRKEKNWRELGIFGTTAFFRKVTESQWFEWEWDKQPFVIENSNLPSFPRLRLVVDLATRATKHLCRGDREKLRRGFEWLFSLRKR